MAIYIGSTKCKLALGEKICGLNIPTPIAVTNGIRLLSSDDYILKDINNVYLTTIKEDE